MWERFFASGFEILRLHGTHACKANAGGFTTVMETHDGVQVGIAVIQGHVVVKSLRRMVRRTFRRLRGIRLERPSRVHFDDAPKPQPQATHQESAAAPDPASAGSGILQWPR